MIRSDGNHSLLALLTLLVLACGTDEPAHWWS